MPPAPYQPPLLLLPAQEVRAPPNLLPAPWIRRLRRPCLLHLLRHTPGEHVLEHSTEHSTVQHCTEHIHHPACYCHSCCYWLRCVVCSLLMAAGYDHLSARWLTGLLLPQLPLLACYCRSVATGLLLSQLPLLACYCRSVTTGLLLPQLPLLACYCCSCRY